MSVTIEAGVPADLLVVRMTGELTLSGLGEDLARLSEASDRCTALLADWRESRFAMSMVEFMALTDDWFGNPVARLRAAHVFHPEHHADHAMLFQTKGFLAGGDFRVFTEYSEARSWLESWTGPRP